MQKCADQTVPGTITERPKAQKGTVTSTPSQHQGHKDTAPRQDKKAKAPRHTLRHDQRRQKIKALSLAHSKKKNNNNKQKTKTTTTTTTTTCSSRALARLWLETRPVFAGDIPAVLPQYPS